MKKLGMFSIMLTLFGAMMLVSADAFAAFGDDILADLRTAIGGSVGTIVGLVIALIGFYMWIVQQASWGIALIIGGVLVTVFPSLMENIQAGTKSAFATSLGTEGLGAATDTNFDGN